MKKYIYPVLLLVIGVLVFASCNSADEIYVDEKQSYYSDFKVEDDKVYIRCYITLINQFNGEKTVNLCAKLPEDVAIGLLKNEEIKALDEAGSEMNFVLPPNSSETFEVVFVGEFAGTNQKQDRNLPEIFIEIVK